MTIQFVRGITASYGEKGRIDFQPLFAKKGLHSSRRSRHTRKQWISSLRERKSSTGRVEKTDPHSADYPLPRPSLFFSFHPILHWPHAKSLFSEWTVEYFLFNIPQVSAIDFHICYKATFFNLSYTWKNRDHRG